MGIKFSSVVICILLIFIAKVSIENFGEANANPREKAQINLSNLD